MKIRKGFVSNSSSSSFIVAFDKAYCDKYPDFDLLLKKNFYGIDLKKTNEGVLEYLREEILEYTNLGEDDWFESLKNQLNECVKFMNDGWDIYFIELDRNEGGGDVGKWVINRSEEMGVLKKISADC